MRVSIRLLVIRRLFRARIFSLTVVATLALGIGATAAVFAVVDAVLLRPLPYDEPGRLVDLSHTLAVSGVTHVTQSDASYLYYRRANRTLSGVGAYAVTAVNVGSLAPAAAGNSQPIRVAAARVSASAFAVLRAAPLAGRVFRDDEDFLDAAAVVLIGERFWHRAYGGDRGITGRRLDIDGVSREIVGIMPAQFRFPAEDTAIWLPIGLDPARTDSASFDYSGIARLRNGVSIAEAEADVQRLLLQLPDAFPGRLTKQAITVTRMRAVVAPLRDVIVGDIGRVLWVVLGAVVCILLVGCTNVATLFLVRGDARHTELAVRRALGAGRMAIVRELTSEAVMLSAAGGALGLGIAAAGIRLLRSFDEAISLPRLGEVGIDGGAVAVAAAVSVLVALFMSGLPALRAAALDGSGLAAGAWRPATAGRGRQRLRRTLVVTQIALGLVLVAAAGLMARSFAHLRAVESGFDPEPVYTFRVALPAATAPAHADRVRILDAALGDLEHLAGVEGVGAATKLPLVDEGRLDTAIFIEDRPLGPGGFPNVHQLAYVSAGYFRALSIPLVAGRTFDPMEPEAVRPQAILSETLVKRYWGSDRAVGRRVRIAPNGEWLTVVGVARDVRGTSLEGPPDEMIYLPLAASDSRWTPRACALVVRSGAAPAAVAPAAAAVLRRHAPAVPLYDMRPMTDVVSRAGARTSVLLLLFGLAAAVALSLGAVGLFGMCSYVVSLRRREIAVRLALGARPADVARMVGGQGVALGVVGVILGLAGAVASTRALSGLLFGLSPVDPATLAASAVLMIAVAAAASWLPARRAAGIDPAQTLRAE